VKIENFRRFDAAEYDFSTDDGKERFFQHLNETVGKSIDALQRKLTMLENMNFEERTFDVEQDTEIEVTLDKIRGKAKGVTVVSADIYDYNPNVAWTHVSSNTVKLKVSFDSAPTSPVEVTLRFEGGG